MDFNQAYTRACQILKTSSQTREEKLQELCEFLQKEMPNYDWVGFYFASEDAATLHLGPYAGEPTDHVVIPFGKGICGQVAVSGKTFLVEDVWAQDNYIACSVNVKSEIVVPLYVAGRNIGQIDIDSHTPKAFDASDAAFLTRLNEAIAALYE